MRVLFLRCHILYCGRIDAELELGDRLIIVKAGGELVVHAASGLNPRNWMPRGSVVEEERSDYMRVTHRRRGEMLEIFIDETFSDQCFEPVLDGRLIKLGSEREISDMLARRPHMIHPDADVIQREYRTPVGPIDILMRERTGLMRPIVVEIKRKHVIPVEVVYQLVRYLDSLMRMEQWAHHTPLGIIVGPGFSKPVTAAAAERGITLVRSKYEQLLLEPERLSWAEGCEPPDDRARPDTDDAAR